MKQGACAGIGVGAGACARPVPVCVQRADLEKDAGAVLGMRWC